MHRRFADGNAAAVSAVLRPPSDLTVSATRAARARAGWQQVNSGERFKHRDPVLEGILGLGQREVAADMARQRRQDARAVLADSPFQRGRDRHRCQPSTITGRTSTEPWAMCGALAAHARAASRSSTSST